jgi:voltage-gated potassium channel
MYSLENEAQPEVFCNAFSGIWWATSTLLTVGYGDIYPITTMGKIFGIFISFLGVGMVAIPTGIISAGFVSQYSNIKKRMEYGYESAVRFIKMHLDEDDRWVGKSIEDLKLSQKIIVAAIKRKEKLLVPRGDMVLQMGDTLILGAEPYEDHESIEIKEIVLQKKNPWTNKKIGELDISRHSVIVLVQRKGKALIPNGNMVLREGDNVFLYTQLHLDTVSEIDL